MIKALQIAGLTLVMGTTTVLAMDYALSIPDVYKSYSTRECVHVENYPGMVFGKETFSCENMPEKFNLVWTQ